MANIYDVGDLVRITATFTDEDAVAIDPTTVSAQIKSPAGTIFEYDYGIDVELVKDGIGVYHTDVDVDAEGTWYYRMSSTGIGQAADEGAFDATSWF